MYLLICVGGICAILMLKKKQNKKLEQRENAGNFVLITVSHPKNRPNPYYLDIHFLLTSLNLPSKKSLLWDYPERLMNRNVISLHDVWRVKVKLTHNTYFYFKFYCVVTCLSWK